MPEKGVVAGVIGDEHTVDLVLRVLRGGGVAVLPTDTLPGLSAMLTSEAGVARVSAIKRAPGDRRYILLASSIEMVDRFVRSYGCGDRGVLERAWPAPLSVVLPAADACPAWVGPTVAIRVPALAPLRVLIERLGEPIVSSSVNRTGFPPLADAQDILREMGGEVDAIVTGPPAGHTASTLVDLTGRAPRLVRRGSYDWDADGAGNPSK